MKQLLTLFGLAILFVISSLPASSQTSFTFYPTDSPGANSYNFNTLNETPNWTNIARTEIGVISSIVVDFTWTTDGVPTEGSLRLRHPDQTITNLITNGVTSSAVTIGANTTTTYSLPVTAFNNKLIAGTWSLWIQDSYGDGGHFASSISITITYTTAPPMTFTSATTLQVTGSAAPGTKKVPVIAARIITAGANPPIDATSFTFSTNGTTEVSKIQNAKVYFTGNSATFDTATAFGNVVVSPNGTFTVTGTQTLVNGNNYFWLSYDIDSSATEFTVVDGECLSMIVDNISRTPTVTAPTNSRKLVVALAGNYNVGTGNYYTTLGSILSDITNVGLTAPVNIYITSNITEPTQVALYAPILGNGTAIRIKPAPGISPIITCNHTGQSLYIGGYNNLTIDGSNTVGGTTRNLTFNNTSTGTVAHGIYASGSTNINIKNVIINNGGSTVGVGVVLNTVTNGTINNCEIFKTNTGIVVQNNCQNVTVKDNFIGNMTLNTSVSSTGITFSTGTGFLVSCNGFTVSNNTINGMIFGGAANGFQFGMNIFNSYNGVIERNTMKNLYNNAGHIIAFYVSSMEITPVNIANLTFKNNSISSFSAATSNGNIYGFYCGYIANVNSFHNTFDFGASSVAPVVVGSYFVGGCENFIYKNNIFINNTPTTGVNKFIYFAGASQTLNPISEINNNLYTLSTGGTFASLLNNTYNNLASWQAYLAPTNGDAASIMKTPVFASAGSPYIAGSALNDPSYLVPLLPDVYNDINDEFRSAYNNFAGADIMIPSAVNFTTNLPSIKEEAFNQSVVYTVIPQISSTFEDGITRTPPTGDQADMSYTWFFNNNLVNQGVNNTTTNRNTLSISSTSTSNNGDYYCLVEYKGVFGLSNSMQLNIVNLPRPQLTLPSNGTVNMALTLQLDWQAVATATKYILEMDTDTNFITLGSFDTIYTNSKIISGLNYYTKYYWRVKAANSQYESNWSDVFSFRTQAPPIAAPTLLLPANNATNIPVAGSLTWEPFVTATGYIVQLSTASTFSSYVINETVTDVNKAYSGLANSTQYYWRVRTLRNVEFSSWSPVRTFTTGAAAVVQSITMATSWNMFSANVEATNPALSNIMAPLSGNLQQMKNVYGQIYAPPFTNSLSTWNKYHAYQVRLTTAAQFQITGAPIVPETTPITLNQLGWYWLPYYRTTQMPTATALASISGKYLQIKSITGEVYQPPFATSLANLDPNKGYMIRMTATDGTLTYPANTIIKASSDNAVLANPKVFVRENNVTGKTAFIALDLNANDGDEVGVFTRDGMLVGSSVWQNGMRGVVVWGDDEFTNEKDGASEGEELTVKVWNAESKNIGGVSQIVLSDMTTNAKEYTLRYETDGVYFLKGAVEAESTTLTVTPQPATTEVMINLGRASESGVEVRLFNQAGKMMLETRENASNGVIKLNTSEMPSGVYQAMISIDGKVQTARVVIVK